MPKKPSKKTPIERLRLLADQYDIEIRLFPNDGIWIGAHKSLNSWFVQGHMDLKDAVKQLEEKLNVDIQ